MIASMLQHNNHLKILDLTGCSSVGQIGVQKLIAGMSQNVSLKLLYLPDNLEYFGNAMQGYDMVESRIRWAHDISTQEEVVLSGSHINSFIGNMKQRAFMYCTAYMHISYFFSVQREG